MGAGRERLPENDHGVQIKHPQSMTCPIFTLCKNSSSHYSLSYVGFPPPPSPFSSPHTSVLLTLQYLCECQFDDNLKFKMAVNEEHPEKMRLRPVGRDRQGLMYWLQLDQEQNIRLYTEEQDDLDGSTWKCIVR